jgi:hypothetical protein
MIYRDGRILPPWKETNFSINHVGISFAYKKKLFDQGMKLTPSSVEDFVLLDQIRGSGYNKTEYLGVCYTFEYE